MGKKRDASEEAEQEPVRITLTQQRVLDDLIGVYGSTRGDVMSYLIKLGLERLRGNRSLRELLDETRGLRSSKPGGSEGEA